MTDSVCFRNTDTRVSGPCRSISPTHFPSGCGFRQQRVGTTNLQYKGSFDAQHKISPENLSGAANLVMLPRHFSDPSLQEHFKLVGSPRIGSCIGGGAICREWALTRAIATGAR